MAYHIFEKGEGKTVARLLFEAGDPMDLPCAGNGRCGKCRVLASGELSLPDVEELSLLGEYAGKGYRLACRARVLGRAEVDHRPTVHTAEAGLEEPDVEEPLAVCDGYAAAIDVGTTTVAVLCVDANSKKITASDAFINPQRAMGADVMSRLSAVMEDPSAAEKMQSMLFAKIEESIKKIFPEAPSAVALCANTVMEHIAAGLDARGIAQYPFTPASLLGDRYRLPVGDIPAYLFPCVAGYVGGDVTAGIVACGLDRTDENILLLDLGTNGELALSHNKRVYTASAAAGPAFEGGNLECGMCAADDAIDRVWIENGKIAWHSDKEPIGICGSAALDALAALLELEIVDETGAMDDDRYEFTEKVWLSGADVRALQLAKAAICAGVRTLCRSAGIKESEISRVLIAGSFGAHLNPQSALRVGIIPSCLEGRIESVGNTALRGAALWLIDAAYRRRLEELKSKLEHVELSLSKQFNQYYIEEMIFE
ncbi:MAG: DUF4445 domain-containing protein [Clostridia bacterium]|nr:DUF4445 domain-containing protein [Clostridia bacterium]